MKQQHGQMGRESGRLLTGLLAGAVMVLGSSTLLAVAVSWDNGAGDNAWGTAQGSFNLNWSGNVTPSAGDDVTINTAVTVNYNTAIYPASSELLRLNVTGGGTLNISQNMNILDNLDGSWTTQALNINNGTVNHTAGDVVVDDTLTLYADAVITGSNAEYNLSGGSLTIASQGQARLYVQNGGTLNVSGGDLYVTGDVAALHSPSGNPTMNFTAGLVAITGGVLLHTGTFAYAAPGGGLAASATNNFGVGNNSGTTANTTLSVLGAPVVNTMSLTGAANDLIFGSAGKYSVTINSAGDLFLDVTGDVRLAGLLSVTDLSGALGTTWTILSASGAMTGAFASFDLPAGFSVVDDGLTTGMYTIMSIPEPTSFGLLALGALALVRRRR